MAVERRIFVVGCARSGTTLLQSLLATQPGVRSFPETHFFNAPRMPRWECALLRFGLLPPTFRADKARRAQDLLAAVAPAPSIVPPRPALRWGQHVRRGVQLLDDLTLAAGCSSWVEKTPSHLHVADALDRTVERASFVHIVRPGPEVVASLFEATRKHPEAWDGAYDIDRCVRRFNHDVAITRQLLSRPNHHLVRYEELTAEPARVLGPLCRSLGLDFHEEALNRYRDEAREVIGEGEEWKARNVEAITSHGRATFESVFSPEEQTDVLARCVDLP